MSTIHAVTANELWERFHDGLRHELVRGELRTMSPAGSEHGVIVVTITLLVGQFVKAQQLGVVFGAETGFKITADPDTVRAPDIAFVQRDRVPPAGIPVTFWPGAPDLAIEVVSPSDTLEGVEDKVADWLDAGTRAVWVVKPRRRNVSIFRKLDEVRILTEGDEIDGQEILPGFRCRVAEFFA